MRYRCDRGGLRLRAAAVTEMGWDCALQRRMRRVGTLRTAAAIDAGWGSTRCRTAPLAPPCPFCPRLCEGRAIRADLGVAGRHPPAPATPPPLHHSAAVPASSSARAAISWMWASSAAASASSLARRSASAACTSAGVLAQYPAPARAARTASALAATAACLTLSLAASLAGSSTPASTTATLTPSLTTTTPHPLGGAAPGASRVALART